MAQPGLTVTIHTDRDAVLSIAGELDIATAPVLRDALLELLQRDSVPDLVVDTSGLTFVDSTGLSILLMGARRWAASEHRMVLRAPSAPLRRVIDLAGVGRAFEIAD